MRYIIALLLTSTAAQAEVPAVVTDIPPVDALVAAVMGDLGQPTLLLDRGASAHSFALRPSQAAALANADLVVWIGPELTPWLATALGSLGETAARLDLLDAPGTERQDFAAKDDHHHDNETEAEDATQGHDHAGIDPHAWLDPDNARLWLGLIAAELARLDPEHAAIYTENATAATAAVDRAEAEADALLAPVKDRPFLAFHDAYGYFTAHYGLTVAGTLALGDAAPPGARRLADLHATLAEGPALCIYPEVGHDPAMIEQLADGSRAVIGGALDPEGSALEPGPDLYPELIVSLARTIAACMP
ncbi:MAG: zinc ABC transporter substrate-binding protein [Rhodobacteraceae bacterium]|jgi:zinc transport system substrate-binding protein|nr:zinc ABC transporter substrate-binding protein [Paracoccaceae bacterium]